MSDAPEWVDPAPDAVPVQQEPPRVSERDILVQAVSASLEAMKRDVALMANNLLRLDEIGEPVTRSRTRVTKLEESRNDLQAHFDFDVVKQQGKPTKDQKVRAERHDLS